jgi:predicted DNA-binding transcriptional regulator AlpA
MTTDSSALVDDEPYDPPPPRRRRRSYAQRLAQARADFAPYLRRKVKPRRPAHRGAEARSDEFGGLKTYAGGSGPSPAEAESGDSPPAPSSTSSPPRLHLDRRSSAILERLAAAPADLLLTRADLAAWLGVSATSIKRWDRVGAGPPRVRVGMRRVRYRRDAVIRWLDERTEHAAADPGDHDHAPPAGRAVGARPGADA